MKRVRLLSLRVEGFRGVAGFTLDAGGKSVTVHGANGTGKSTLADAFLWLLTGKDAQGRANYKIFPTAGGASDDGMEPESACRLPGFSPTVEAKLDYDGQALTLRRSVSEKWTARRGGAKKEYAGDETQYRIDDVPLSAGKYAERIAELFPENLLDLLLNASWFSEKTKDYRERRRLLMEQFGGLTQSGVIAANDALAPLGELLGRHSVEEFSDICTERSKRCREAMTSLPARIDENRKQICELPNLECIRGERGRCNVEIAKLRYGIEHLSADGLQRQRKAELEQIRAELGRIPLKRRIVESGVSDEWRREHEKRAEDARALCQRCGEAVCTALAELRQAEVAMADAAIRRDRLREQWMSVNTEEPPAVDACPACGRPMTEEMARAALERFHLDRSERLAGIAVEGARAAALTDDCAARVDACVTKHAQAQEELCRADRALALVRAETPPAVRPELILELEEEEAGLKEREAALQKDMDGSAHAAEEASREMRARLEELQARSDALGAQIAAADRNAALEQRIRELEAEQRATLQQMEEAERGLALCREFSAARSRMLTRRVNGFFRTIRFQLFEAQKNGGFRETCEAYVDGVPYSTANTAAKLQANLEIVQAFSESAGVTLPLFLDNRESVTHIDIPDWMQVIHLKVDEAAKDLQVKGV